MTNYKESKEWVISAFLQGKSGCLCQYYVRNLRRALKDIKLLRPPNWQSVLEFELWSEDLSHFSTSEEHLVKSDLTEDCINRRKLAERSPKESVEVKLLSISQTRNILRVLVCERQLPDKESENVRTAEGQNKKFAWVQFRKYRVSAHGDSQTSSKEWESRYFIWSPRCSKSKIVLVLNTLSAAFLTACDFVSRKIMNDTELDQTKIDLNVINSRLRQASLK